jgi:hypothetical protein
VGREEKIRAKETKQNRQIVRERTKGKTNKP